MGLSRSWSYTNTIKKHTHKHALVEQPVDHMAGHLRVGLHVLPQRLRAQEAPVPEFQLAQDAPRAGLC